MANGFITYGGDTNFSSQYSTLNLFLPPILPEDRCKNEPFDFACTRFRCFWAAGSKSENGYLLRSSLPRHIRIFRPTYAALQ